MKSLAVALVVLFATSATADPAVSAVHINVPFTARTDAGNERRFEPGYYLTEDAWAKWDVETQRLQIAETRLEAENESLRTSLDQGPGWGTVGLVVSALAAGAAATWAATR